MLANGSIPIIFNKEGEGYIKVDALLGFFEQTLKELNNTLHPANPESQEMESEELFMTQGAAQMLAGIGYELSELLVFNYDLQDFKETVSTVQDFLNFTEGDE
jgi:hypothetical protein